MKLTDAEWIFFDIGSTLFDETEAHNTRAAAALERLYEEKGITVTLEEVNAYSVVLGKNGCRSPSPSSLRHFGAKKYPHYRKDLEVPYSSVPEVLERLHEKYKLGIISNQLGGTVKRLQQFDLLRHLDIVYSSAEMGMEKPAPDIFVSALKAVGCPPERAVMVGDRPDNDIIPAKKLGMMAVRVRQGFYREMEIPDTPDTPAPDGDIFLIDDLPDIMDC